MSYFISFILLKWYITTT